MTATLPDSTRALTTPTQDPEPDTRSLPPVITAPLPPAASIPTVSSSGSSASARQTAPAASGRTAYRAQGRRRALAKDALTVLAVVSFALPLSFFLADGGFAQLTSGVGGFYTGLGIVAGLVATASMVLMLLLAARIPAIDRAFGQDRAVKLHADLGQWTFGGLLMHGALLMIGYGLSDGQSPVAEFFDLFGGTPDFALAVASVVVLTAVAVSSVVAVKAKLPHEVWHGIHLLSYAAVALAIPHQFSMGGLFESGPARVYWAAMFVATGFALLTWRIFLPLFSSLEHQLVVTHVTREAPDVVSIEMTGRRLAGLSIDAGQYFHWRFLARGLWWHQHPFSVSARPAGNTLRITVRNLGNGTAALMNVRVGTRVFFEGPYGLFSDRSRTADDVVMVGVGIGIAPVRALLEETEFAPGRATVVLRASADEEQYLCREIEALCRTKGARLVVLTGHRGRDAAGHDLWTPAGYEQVRLDDLAPDIARADVYICGPQAAADLIIADARAAGVPADRIHQERFAW